MRLARSTCLTGRVLWNPWTGAVVGKALATVSTREFHCAPSSRVCPSRLKPSLAIVVLASLVAHAAKGEEPVASSTVRAARPDADGASITRLSTDTFAGELRHVGDIVGSAPSTSVIDYGGILATTVVSVRGASPDEVQVLFDGVPLNASVGGGFDLTLIPAALVDSVDVHRGSDGSRLGAGAMGGAVVLEPVSRTRALLTVGSLGTLGGSASFATKPFTNGWKLLAAADLRHSTGDFRYHRDPTPEFADNDPVVTLTRTNNDATLASVLLRGSGPLARGTLSAMALLSGSDRGLAGGIYSPTATSRQREGNGLADLRWRTLEGASTNMEVPVTVRGGWLQTIESGLAASTGWQHVLDISVRPRFGTKAGDWTFAATAVGGYETFDGVAFGPQSRVRGALGLDAAVESGRWMGSVGLRGERWGNAGALLPRAGGTVQLTHGAVLAANVGLGFRPPSFGELYYSSGPVVPNPDLLPERSVSADFGVRLKRGALSGAVTTFGGLYQDIILYDLYPGFRAKPFNIGQARSFGVELEARWKAPAGALEGTGAMLSATELVTQNLVAGVNTYGMELPYRPAQRLVARVDCVQERWRAAVEVQATGVAYINRSNTRTLSPFADLRSSVGVRLINTLWLSAELRNGLDVMDRMTIDGYPLPGRVFLANLSWEPEVKAETP